MKQEKATIAFKENDSPIMQNSIPTQMLIACLFSCFLGIALMAALSHYLLMVVFIRKEGAEYAIIMMDVNKFKRNNDLYGHNLGDSVLKNMAASITKQICPEDYAFRFGGDEFLFILPRINRETAHEICKRIEAGLQSIHGYAFPLTVSMGCALRSESTNSTEVLHLADQLMYESKKSKR